MNRDDYIKFRTCIRKKKYSKIAADWKIEEIAREKNKPMYYYSCTFCGRYHLTKKEPSCSIKQRS